MFSFSVKHAVETVKYLTKTRSPVNDLTKALLEYHEMVGAAVKMVERNQKRKRMEEEEVESRKRRRAAKEEQKRKRMEEEEENRKRRKAAEDEAREIVAFLENNPGWDEDSDSEDKSRVNIIEIITLDDDDGDDAVGIKNTGESDYKISERRMRSRERKCFIDLIINSSRCHESSTAATTGRTFGRVQLYFKNVEPATVTPINAIVNGAKALAKMEEELEAGDKWEKVIFTDIANQGICPKRQFGNHPIGLLARPPEGSARKTARLPYNSIHSIGLLARPPVGSARKTALHLCLLGDDCTKRGEKEAVKQVGGGIHSNDSTNAGSTEAGGSCIDSSNSSGNSNSSSQNTPDNMLLPSVSTACTVEENTAPTREQEEEEEGYYEAGKTFFEFHGCFYHGCVKCFRDGRDNPIHNNSGETINTRPLFELFNPLLYRDGCKKKRPRHVVHIPWAYHTFFSGTGIHFLNEGNAISREAYPHGYCLTAFDLTPDLSSNLHSHWNLVRQGSLRLDVRFEQALPDTLTCVIYADFDNIIEIDRSRNVLVDFGG
ncbi:hypothetical protein J437_LFUL018337 [Ladona fulva]|uniref:Uncharacterized protein n=1 Tax=Ladona fulva TaxID=123851 RepID=A0A8K0PB12_LADFU|nr:hypothetical protein J437_LFUL018337 [Ladona fulva]